MFRVRRILRLIDLAHCDRTSLIECYGLAEKFGADVHLLHVVPKNSVPTFGSRKRIEQSQDGLSAYEVPSSGIQTYREMREGELVECICDYAREHSIDLVSLDQGELVAWAKSSRSPVSELQKQLNIPVLLTNGSAVTREQIVEAAQTLLRELGAVVRGDRNQTWDALKLELKNRLRTSELEADVLLNRLEKLDAMKWNEKTEGGEDGSPAEGYWQLNQAIFEDTPEDQADEERRFIDPDASAAISLIERGIEMRATDIHIDPSSGHSYTVQFRVDGKMEDFCRLHQHVAGTTMKQLKLMANISLANPFQPSESRLELPEAITANVEVRITVAPVAHGDAIALRLIDREKLSVPLSEIGLSTRSFAAVYQMLHHRSGLVLIAGPTGAGKTTTAYSLIKVLVNEKQKIISLESPVELVVPFMRQLAISDRHGFTMRSGLSTVLRMDPDVVFIGEIRDAEAAHIAMQAAASGKRAFSTIHMRDVSACVTAMREFDIDGKTLANSLSGIIAQRLVRCLCRSCCTLSELTRGERAMFEGLNMSVPSQLSRARGCASCRGTGYHGRTGVFEAVVIDAAIADAIRHDQHESELRNLIQGNSANLTHDGLSKVRDGITTIEELQNVTWLDDSRIDVTPSGPDFGVYERGLIGSSSNDHP